MDPKDVRTHKLTLTIIMPALNEEANIFLALQNTLDALDSFGIDSEIIVVNDGSTDSTPEIITELKKKDARIRSIDHDKPQGIGAAFWEGVGAANNEVVVMLPGDNENDPWEILRYFHLLEHVDIVIPFVYNKETRSLFRNFLSLAYRFIINTTFGVNFNYTNGTVMYRKTIVQEIPYHSSGFFFQTDILIRSVVRGYLFAEVPYRLGQRIEGKSKAVSYPSLVKVIKGYLKLVGDFYFKKEEKITGDFAEGSTTSGRRTFENNRYKT
jgi:glycosyltransferase involved in cell wall biosynthesis